MDEVVAVARRRKVNNLLALAVFSVLVQRPMHPYEMASVLRERGKDRDMKIKWGSLYTVVQNLERHGLISTTGSLRQGGRPERTVYQLTAAGHEEFRDWVRELISTPEREQPRFEAGLSVLGVLSPDETIELLQQRLADLAGQLADQRAALDRHSREIPRLFLIENEYDLAVRAAEAAWIRSFLDELGGGTLPGLEQWRAWHETGELPADLTELAERGAVPD